ncbi:anthranilate synthase component I [Brevibacillus invocatus]|uniref:Anthranilate synthase component 1 n=1 Tax=Brevibacillus invocatus TaxID=173959 RepID=A0A3M8CIF5_9BACL|nr:anthranilate synthase component I [Brevibacillus invocatus]MCM3077889.1 anthranilate synthase component I [Brevibacillus invocatus]MCM3428037.1 anthranilate synthase component I [Brevibacillus invocatus]RNB75343.1 anthranilate synthase component I [Brevibacillus invocatus]
MYFPSLAEVQSLSATYSFIPVSMTLLADQETPIRLYQKIRTRNSFLLESVEGGARWARFSFIGMNPFQIVEAKGNEISVSHRDGTAFIQSGNPINYLRAEVDRYKSPKLPGFPRLSGGAVGFFGYNTLHYFENLPPHRSETLRLPDMRFLFVDEMVAFDHLKQEIQLIVNLHVEAGDTASSIAEKYAQVCERLEKLAGKVTTPAQTEQRISVAVDPLHKLEVEANMSREEYEKMVVQAKEYIAAGDIFQVVLSQRFSVKTDVDPFAVYRILRTLNPSPYMYYLEYEGETIVGTSPELLVRVEDQKVEMRPIAGTRKRGATPREDELLAADLLADEKERAEHYMLLDLGRNDVGRVSSYGSVKVEEALVIENYSHVMHMVSHVTGKLREDLHPFDALLSAFPAGTVSGSPKLRAMEIIAELEQDARHLYAGAIGYISFDGSLDSCITIRTLFFQDGQAHVQAGAGIVADSVPASEYQETRNKAAAMITALEKAEQLFARKEELPC